MSQSEIDHLMGFIAREIIDMVKQRCRNSMENPDDPKELEGIIKEFLDGQNLKQRLWAAVRLNLRK